MPLFYPPSCLCTQALRAYVKDVTLGEDRTLIHKDNRPAIVAIMRDTVIGLLHWAGWRIIRRVAALLLLSEGSLWPSLAFRLPRMHKPYLETWGRGKR